MQFQLELDNRGATDETLLDDLRAVAAALNLTSVSRNEYESKGRFHPKTLVNRFGSWNGTLTRAGLGLRRVPVVLESQFLDDVKRVALLLAAETVTTEQYSRHGRFSLKPVPRLFGEWRHMLARLDMKPSPHDFRTLSDSDLVENLERIWRTVGRQPRQSDLRTPLSIVGYKAYVRRFGTWRAALEHFVEIINRESALDQSSEYSVTRTVEELAISSVKENPSARTANWRLRFLVMRRDSFRCCQCGASPALSPGVVLVIDHIVAWSAGGQTVMENLQTLCVPCNGGKSDLDATVT